jgi:hypothetical protein
VARNPRWEEEELVLALDVYFRFPEARQSKAHPEVAQLSEDLRALRLPIERPDPEKFRNINGAFLKLQNLKALDPDYTADGRVGMTAGATLREQALWDRYATDREGLHAAAERIRAGASSSAVSDRYRATVAGQINAWWQDDPSEVFWLEITDRVDIGVDLHAPQRDASGARTPGYSLIWWVAPGDIVFHYDRNQRAIVSWSRAVGQVEEAAVIWLSHRAATRRRIGGASPQPGWWLDLEGPYPLSRIVTLADLRSRGDDIRVALQQLQARREGSIYFPFFFYRGVELRPMQPYLNKLPAAVVALLSELREAADDAATIASTQEVRPTEGIGTSYRVAAVSSLPAGRDPFTVDPAVVERGLRGHAETQNGLAATLKAAGLNPRSPRPGEPNFDIAWEARDGTVFVAEVKSVTDLNEERQLRLGLGQVLRYRDLMRSHGHADVRAVLVAEREPRDASWARLCEEVDVTLTFAPEFVALGV